MCTPCYFTAWLVDHDSGVHHFIPRVAFLLDCRLNDPNVTVELHRKLGETFQRVYPWNDTSVKQTGQNFTIFNLNTTSQFNCTTAGQDGTPVLKKEVKIEKAKGLKQ